MNNDKKIKQYKVIEFLDKHLVSVIPSNWVLEDGHGSCVWPLKLKNTRTLIIKRPADNWGQYERSSFIDHGSFDSYENALQHETKIVRSSESEDNIPSSYGRKIKTKKLTDYEEYLQPPSPTLSTARFSSGSSWSTVAKVNAFENSRFNNVTAICESVDKVTALLPLKSITFEEMIETDTEVKSQLRGKLSFVGGSDFQNLIRRCLPKLLTDDLAQQCSWTGQKNNFQINDLCLMKIFAEAVSSLQTKTVRAGSYGMAEICHSTFEQKYT